MILSKIWYIIFFECGKVIFSSAVMGYFKLIILIIKNIYLF